MNDSAAASPLVVVVIALSTMGFEALVFGEELAASSFPDFLPVNFDECDDSGSGFFSFDDRIGCFFANVGHAIANFFIFLYGAGVFFWNVVSFNVGGAPWFVRLVVGSIFGGTVLWALVGVFRGN